MFKTLRFGEYTSKHKKKRFSICSKKVDEPTTISVEQYFGKKLPLNFLGGNF